MKRLLQHPSGWTNDLVIDTFMGSLQEQNTIGGDSDAHFFSSWKGYFLMNGDIDTAVANQHYRNPNPPGTHWNCRKAIFVT